MKTCPHFRLRHLLAATLAIGGVCYSIAPVLSQVAAGTLIRNTATGTFTDGTNSYNTTSNEVTIEVSEIAGIEVMAQPPSNSNPNAGDTLHVEFVITNIGNDPTQFFIPGTATLSNTTAFAQNGQIQIVAVDGVPLPSQVNVPTGGDSTANLLGNPTLLANPGSGTVGTVTVRVPIQVLPTAIAGNTLTVSLGDTTPVNGSNLELIGPPGPKDLYTIDNNNGVGGETNTTAPLNGTREAMATSATISVAARLQSFAAVLKAVGGYSNGNTPNILTDDKLTYRLALKVDNPTTPPTGFVASDLYGTELNVNGSTADSYVLVSDAIPAGTQLGDTADITAPPNWIPVYTTSDLTTSALDARWLTTRPTSGTITRIGFIFKTNTTPTPTPISKGSVGLGNTISGFSFVVTPLSGFTGGQIANIAQVFGQSQPGTVVPGTPTQIVYDESGDQTTNNGLVGSNPDPDTGGASSTGGSLTNGVANTATDGVDPGTGTDPTNTGNTNQGSDTGPNAGTNTLGGEDTVYTIAAMPLNGPNGQPAAVGPTDNNDDFTNKSVVIPPNTPPNVAVDANPVTFNNTVQNTSGNTQTISLLPTPPATATALPNDTSVTITTPTGSATYTYNSVTGFTFVSGTNGASATNPVSVSVTAGGTANYTVTVDLPSAAQLTGYPVPITAFVDINNDGLPANEPSNITIDRLYTNYLSLVKRARILEADGIPVAGPAGTFTTVQADLSAAATPGRIIEYQITYQNISIGGGTNNVILPANNLVITENGSAGTNNWSSFTLDPVFAVSGGNGSAIDPNGTIAVTTGGTPTDIQEYRDTVNSVAPGGSGTFIFRRKIK